MRIASVDYWEKDALLVIGSAHHYFQFDGDDVTLLDALKFFEKEEHFELAREIKDYLNLSMV